MKPKDTTEVVSFRIDPKILRQFDRLAKDENRSRGNMIAILLNRSVALKEAWTHKVEYLVKTINEEQSKTPDSPFVEYHRGMLSAVKDAIASVYGKHEKDRILDEIRERTELAIPHIVPLYNDGKRYGFDLDEG